MIDELKASFEYDSENECWDLKEKLTEYDVIKLPEEFLAKANAKAKDGRSKMFGYEMNGEELMKIWERPTTLKQTAQRNLIRCWVANKELTIFPLISDVTTELLRIQTSEYMKLVKYFDEQCIEKFRTIYQIPECIKGWFETDYNWEDFIEDLIEEAKENSICREVPEGKSKIKIWIPKEIEAQLEELEKQLKTLDFKIINGYAGSGKSTEVVQYLKQNSNSESLICTLSNTIGLMFKQKYGKIKNYSITRMRHAWIRDKKGNKTEICDNDIIVIDEFSQWGVESLDVLLKIIHCNPTAKYFFMGDLTQIPTFLSSGSLLFTMMMRFPDKTEKKKELYRFSGWNKSLMYKIINKEKIDFEIKEFNAMALDGIDCIITGTNDHVDFMNLVMIAVKFKERCEGLRLSEIVKKCTSNRFGQSKFEIIASRTKKVNEVKVNANERFQAWCLTGDTYRLKSELDGSEFSVRAKELDKTFKPGYAITVNKSQGLEWPSTCVYMTSRDRNLMNHNALYVALSRSSNELLMLSSDEGNLSRKITNEDLNKFLNKSYKAMDLFKKI